MVPPSTILSLICWWIKFIWKFLFKEYFNLQKSMWNEACETMKKRNFSQVHWSMSNRHEMFSFISFHSYLFKVGIYIVLKNKANLHQLSTINLKKYILKTKEFSVYLQIVQRQLVPSQVLISFLKAATGSVFFASSFRVFYNMASLYLKEFILYFIVWDLWGSLHKTFLRML